MAKLSYLTKQQCAVFCRIENKEDVIDALKMWLHDSSELKTSIDEDGDLVVSISDLGVRVEFYVLMRERGGDGVSKTLLGAYNYFKKIEPEYETNKEFVLNRISKCNASIGVSGSPEFSEKNKHFEYILSLVMRFDGVIFNGSGAVNEKGDLLLDASGKSSVEVTINGAGIKGSE